MPGVAPASSETVPLGLMLVVLMELRVMTSWV